jgi:hypothetical protein
VADFSDNKPHFRLSTSEERLVLAPKYTQHAGTRRLAELLAINKMMDDEAK